MSEYLPELLHRWWIIGLSIVPAIIMLGISLADTTNIVLITLPSWTFRIFWAVGLLCAFTIAPFFAFHKVRVERDETQRLLESKPSVWIRTKGNRALSDPRKPHEEYDKRLSAWYFDVNIANTSPTMTLGIRSFVLEVNRSGIAVTIRPHLGKPNSELGNAPVGDISGTFSLGPNVSISGTVVFVESVHWDYEGGNDYFDDATLVMIDNLGGEYRFPTNDYMEFTNR